MSLPIIVLCPVDKQDEKKPMQEICRHSRASEVLMGRIAVCWEAQVPALIQRGCSNRAQRQGHLEDTVDLSQSWRPQNPRLRGLCLKRDFMLCHPGWRWRVQEGRCR